MRIFVHVSINPAREREVGQKQPKIAAERTDLFAGLEFDARGERCVVSVPEEEKETDLL